MEFIITNCDEYYVGRGQNSMGKTNRRAYFIQNGQQSHGVMTAT